MGEEHFRRGQIVEVRSDDDGFRGSWYVATIIRLPSESSASKWKKNLLVEYKSLMDDQKISKPLREYANVSNIRPLPPESTDQVFELNDEVDAFYNDGWWTGSISRVLENSRFAVHFLSGEEMEVGLSDLRVHLEWIDGQWVQPKELRKNHQGATSLRFRTGTLVEVSFDDDNYLGAWFPATVLEETGNDSFLVEYHSLRLSGEAGVLKVTVDSKHIRPSPQTLSNKSFRLLEKVDAFNNFGWWSGVITKVLANGGYNVYFKHWNIEKEFDVLKLRLHIEWIDGKWVRDSQEISITSHSLGGTNSVDEEKLWQAGNTAQSTGLTIQLTSAGAAENDAKNKSPSYAANSIKNKTSDSTLNNDAELSQPCKKSKKGEATESPIALISSVVTTMSARTLTLAVAQSDFSIPITKDEGINPLNPLLFDDQPSTTAIIPLQENSAASPLKIPLNPLVEMYKDDHHTPSSFGQEKHAEVDRLGPSTKSGRSHDLECRSSVSLLSVEGSRIRSSGSCKSNLPLENIDEQSKFVVSPETTQHSRRQKQFSSQSQRQMKIVLCGTEIEGCKVEAVDLEAGVLRKRGRPPKQKEIEPQKVKGVGKDLKVLKRRGRPTRGRAAKEKLINTNASTNGSEVLGKRGSRPEKVHQNLDGEHLELMRDERELNDPVMHKKTVSNTMGSSQKRKGRPPKLKNTKGVAEKKERLSSKRRRRSETLSDLETLTKENTSEVGMPVTRASSDVAEDERPLAMYLKDLHSPPLMDDKGVMLDDQLLCQSNEAITWIDASNENLEIQKSFILNESFSLEESTFIDNRCNEASGEQSEVVLNFKDNQCNEAREDRSEVVLNFKDNQCNEAKEDRSEVVMQSTVIDYTPNEMPAENAGLPFVKSSFMWKEIESMKAFIDMPQKPHFRPLVQYNKEHREGMAIGHMVTFANLIQKICKLQLDNPGTDFEDISRALLDLEALGFNVEKVQDRLQALLSIKDKQVLLEDKSKSVKGKIVELNNENDRLNVEINEIDDRLEELQKSISQLNEKRASVIMKKKEINGSGVTDYVKEMVEIGESIRSAKLDFQSVAAGPW